MILPRDISRCPGQLYDAPQGRRELPECANCARRTEGIRDYMAGADVEWMDAPQETPCPMRLEPKA